MIKYAVILANALGVLAFHIYVGNDITITHNIPAEAAPGSVFVVAFQIDKNNVSGFGKLQLDVPEGMNIEAVERRGASFTFTDNRVKLIWFKLPEENSITVSLRFLVSKDLSGSQVIAGKFSYMNESQERKFEEIVPKKIKIFKGAQIQQNPIRVTPSEESGGGSLANTAGGSNAGGYQGGYEDEDSNAGGYVADPSSAGLPTPQARTDVSASRSITPLGANSWNVDVVIDKSSMAEYGKLTEIIAPFAFDVVQTNGKKCRFEYDKPTGVITFTWPIMPIDPQLVVGYTVTLRDQTKSGDQNISGSFDYLQAGNPNAVDVGNSSFFIAESVASTTNSINDNVSVENTNSSASSNDYTSPPPIPSKEKQATKPKSTGTPTGGRNNSGGATKGTESTQAYLASGASAKGISYRVQISAGHESVDEAYFRKRHRFEGRYNIENHEGWMKYTTGSYSIYKDGRDQRVALDQAYDFPGPFVTAYNDGVRITVQEALMITNQKWMP